MVLVHKSSFLSAHSVCLSFSFSSHLSLLRLHCNFGAFLLSFWVSLASNEFFIFLLLLQNFTPCSYHCRSAWLTICFSSLSIWPMDLEKQSFITAYLTCNSLIKCLYIIRKQFHGHFPGYSNICKW